MNSNKRELKPCGRCKSTNLSFERMGPNKYCVMCHNCYRFGPTKTGKALARKEWNKLSE